ncbi:MAG: relaxase domain-containing protein [Micropruina sp.]|nr:relaxase domain-containing protein [Micropruina sp.]
MDSTEKGHTGLASYYTQKGETPGVWVGSGMAGIDGLDAGDPVTAEQMRFLFGSGHHPLARQRGEALPPDATAAQARDAIRLGQPFKVYAHDMPAFRIEVAKRFAAYNAQVGARTMRRSPRRSAPRFAPRSDARRSAPPSDVTPSTPANWPG